MAVATTTVVASNTTESPYKLDPEQTLKASRALLGHIQAETKRLQETTSKRNLLETEDSDEDDDEQPIWLTLATKQHIVDKNKLKPSKIQVPHSLNNASDLNICLITTDPQRAVKNTIADPTFPAELSAKINKVIGITKLQARYKSFESRRQLLSEHDVFLADERIITRLPATLGKIFYKGTAKRPIPIAIAPRKSEESKQAKKDLKKKGENFEASVASPTIVAAEIERAINCVPISLKPGLNVAVRIGLKSFTSEQVAANIAAVVPNLIEKHVVKGWRNVKSISIKSPTSFAVPIWLSDDLWAEEDKVMNAEGVAEAKAIEAAKTEEKKRKRNANTSKGPQTGQNKRPKVSSDKAEEKVQGDQRKKRLAAQKAKTFETGV